jgi:DNA ligase-1
MKPMKAEDAVPEKIRFPVIAQPKIDGVRGLTTEGKLTTRTLKPHANAYVQRILSRPEYAWLDGELGVGGPMNHPDLRRMTSSALSTHTGAPQFKWYLFDYLAPHVYALPYRERYQNLIQHITDLSRRGDIDLSFIEVVQSVVINNHAELEEYERLVLASDFEGVILRDPEGMHKQGQSTVREGGLLRLKRFVEEEGLIIGWDEAMQNNNPEFTNELGHTARTSHQENKVGKGMVGALHLRRQNGEECTCGPGALTHAEREHMFANPGDYIEKAWVTFKHFPKGVKDKPLLPTFVSFRGKEEM